MLKMGLSKKQGEYGQYWGNDYYTSTALNMDQMKLNAKYIYKYFSNKDYTKNAICGMLGNMQTESTLNPGRWEGDRVEWQGHGYGIVQWTPYTKYTTWCRDRPEDMNTNLDRIVYEVEYNKQWIKTESYPLTFYEFMQSYKTPEYLAQAFLHNYERPSDPDQPARSTQARFWWDYLSGIEPDPPVPVRVQNTRKWLCSRCFRINIRR